MTVSRKSFVLGATALSATALITACGSRSSESAGSGETISIEHAFGTTEVPVEVSRVATIGWAANQDALLTLGIMPVGFEKQTWGVEDGSGMLPWTKSKVDELVAAGAEQPALFDATDGVDFEAVNSSAPDVILATYSGLNQEQYDKLTKIAPTVAYPELAWGTPWRDTITINTTAVGKKDEGESLVKDLEGTIAAEVAKYPKMAGKRAAFFFQSETDASTIGFYTTSDPRTAFLTDLGLATPDSVSKVSEEQKAKGAENSFFYNISSENVDEVKDVELMVMYGTEDKLATYQADPLIGTIPAVKNGAIAFVGNADALSASASPTALSIPWGIDKYVARIGAAADKVQ